MPDEPARSPYWRRCSYCGAEPINFGHTCPGLTSAIENEAANAAENRALSRYKAEAELRKEWREAARRAEAYARLGRVLDMLDKVSRRFS